MAPAIVAVHCAGRCTGIARRAGDTLTGWWLFTHAEDPLPAYAQAVVDRLATLVEPGDRLALVALPSPTALLGHGAGYGVVRRAVLLGALLTAPDGWAPLLCRPALYGSWQLAGYPAELVGPRERAGAGRLRACRAAWDLAGAAMPGGPPTAAAEAARLGELATVAEDPEAHWPGWPGWRTIRRTCHVCGSTSPRHLRDDDPTSAADEHADFTHQHVTWHLEASGRAGSLLLADTAQATSQPARTVA
jgi:hypothetical protein